MWEYGWFKETLLLTQADCPVVYQTRKQLSAAHTQVHTGTAMEVRHICIVKPPLIWWLCVFLLKVGDLWPTGPITDSTGGLNCYPDRLPSLWAALMFLENMFTYVSLWLLSLPVLFISTCLLQVSKHGNSRTQCLILSHPVVKEQQWVSHKLHCNLFL